jgi:DNA-binding NarL/FixJ family response regulator
MKPHILFVEDEPDARESLCRAIERAGSTCTAVGTKAEALASATSGAFIDLVVTDVFLGRDERAGLELIPELRALGCDAPIIVITAFADVTKVKFALNAGAAHLLEKPFRAQELLDVIARVLRTPADVTHQVERTLVRCGLTDKELVIARQLLKGLTSAEIAAIEGNSEKTVRQHVSQIYSKCGVSTRGGFFHFVVPL